MMYANICIKNGQVTSKIDKSIYFNDICKHKKLKEKWNCNGIGILLPKLFWPPMRKKCSSDREKLLKFEAKSQEFAKFLRSLEQFIQTVRGQNYFW